MSRNAAVALSTQAIQQLTAIGVPLTDPLIDKTSLGSFWVRVGVTIGTTDTNVAIQLPRKPSMYWIVRNSSTATVYDGSTPANWTGLNITLRASASTTVTVLVG